MELNYYLNMFIKIKINKRIKILKIIIITIIFKVFYSCYLN